MKNNLEEKNNPSIYSKIGKGVLMSSIYANFIYLFGINFGEGLNGYILTFLLIYLFKTNVSMIVKLISGDDNSKFLLSQKELFNKNSGNATLLSIFTSFILFLCLLISPSVWVGILWLKLFHMYLG